jgi:hypothetical protein
MPFSVIDKQKMLSLKGVGVTVISRLEQIGFCRLSELAQADAASITLQISQLMGSICWHNSPQARRCITAIIELAKESALPD